MGMLVVWPAPASKGQLKAIFLKKVLRVGLGYRTITQDVLGESTPNWIDSPKARKLHKLQAV